MTCSSAVLYLVASGKQCDFFVTECRISVYLSIFNCINRINIYHAAHSKHVLFVAILSDSASFKPFCLLKQRFLKQNRLAPNHKSNVHNFFAAMLQNF